jgi:Mrp family chromosome partitioning ATPase/capsular polysaccharide biosynthesis protein
MGSEPDSGPAFRAGAWLSRALAAELDTRLRIGESLHSGLRRATDGTVPFVYATARDGNPQSMNDTATDGTSIFAPLWKRKWLILAVAVIAGLGTYLYYKRQAPVYGASTQLYFGSAAEQQGAGSGSSSIGKTGLSARGLTDQAAVINSAIIGLPARKKLREEGDLAAARGKVVAKANNTNDFIAITTEARTPKGAVALANGYAAQYIKRQRSQYLRNIRTQLVNTRAQLRRIEPPLTPTTTTTGKGKTTKAATPSSASELQAASLQNKISQLENALTSYAGVQQVGLAKGSGPPLSPKPKQNAIFGFVLGLLLASIAAYVLSRFDRRVRSLSDLEELYQAQILAALPAVRTPVLRSEGRPRPAKALLEPLRRLHTTLHLGDMLNGNPENRPRVLLVVSPDAGDGRSSMIANLALVTAEAGERVAVVEADFRRPTLGRVLEVSGPNGLAQVLAGQVEPAVAMQPVHMPATSLDAAAGASPNGAVETAVQTMRGSASLLLHGAAAPNPPALLGSEAMAQLVRALRDDYDYVLIDAPPPLEVSDAMPLLPQVDGILILARIGHTRDVSAERLAQLLAHTSTAPLLGVVGNCVSRKDIQRYGFTWMPAAARRRRPAAR